MELNYNAERITASLYYFNYRTQDWLEKNVDWLRHVSGYGVALYLERAERLGYIKSECVNAETGELHYFITYIGREVVKSKHPNIKAEITAMFGDRIKGILTKAETELSLLLSREVRLLPQISDPIKSDLSLKIRDTVCLVCNVTWDKVQSKSRKREIVLARQLYCFYMCFYTKLSLKRIGETIGGRDHTTVIHSRQTIIDLLDSLDEMVTMAHGAVLKILTAENAAITELFGTAAA